MGPQRLNPETPSTSAPADQQERESGSSFRSILFRGAAPVLETELPAFFGDLNLDQLLTSLTAGRERYELAPLFCTPLHDAEDVRYRQDVLRDIDSPVTREILGDFARRMCEVRDRLAQAEKLRHTYQKDSWFHDAVATYCDGVRHLTDQLVSVDLCSKGFLDLGRFLAGYAESEGFVELVSETQDLDERLQAVRYCLSIHGGRVTVTRYEGEADYSAEVAGTFERFKQGAVKDYRVRFPSFAEMNHVETQVLDRVALLFPDVFATLHAFRSRHAEFLDRTIRDVDREVQLYLAYLELIEPLRGGGLAFCYPVVSTESKEIKVDDAFDLPLALKLHSDKATVVPNGFSLVGDERIIVVTGPNQGGKTTFARMFGQLHYLASLGLLVPGTDAQLFLPDQLFTHFEREESIETLHGKLEDELIRIHDILERATGRSLIVMNESFSSTTLDDALALSRAVLGEIVDRDTLCLYVTFIDELTALPKTISMVSTVNPDDPAERTFRIERRDADGLAYAAAIAAKYGLSSAALKARLRR